MGDSDSQLCPASGLIGTTIHVSLSKSRSKVKATAKAPPNTCSIEESLELARNEAKLHSPGAKYGGFSTSDNGI